MFFAEEEPIDYDDDTGDWDLPIREGGDESRSDAPVPGDQLSDPETWGPYNPGGRPAPVLVGRPGAPIGRGVRVDGDNDDGAGTGEVEVYNPDDPQPVHVGGLEFLATAEERRAGDRDAAERAERAAEYWGRAAAAIREPPETALLGMTPVMESTTTCPTSATNDNEVNHDSIDHHVKKVRPYLSVPMRTDDDATDRSPVVAVADDVSRTVGVITRR